MEPKIILLGLLLTLNYSLLTAAEKPIEDVDLDLEPKQIVDIAAALAAEADEEERTSAIENGFNDKWAIITKTSNGNEMVFPYYTNETRSLPEALKENIRGDIEEALGFISGLFDLALVSKSNFLSKTGQLTKKIYDLQKMGRKQAVRRKALGMNQPFQKLYNRDMQKMFARLLKKSGEYEKVLKANGHPKDPEALKLKLDRFLADLNEGFHKSPVVIFVDWPNSFMSAKNALTGQMEVLPFETVAGNLMGEVKLNGYSLILNGMGALIALINNLSG